jgi:hypothetical protein
MLKKRITEEYVDDSCLALEEKLKRDVFFIFFFLNYNYSLISIFLN